MINNFSKSRRGKKIAGTGGKKSKSKGRVLVTGSEGWMLAGGVEQFWERTLELRREPDDSGIAGGIT